MCHKRPERDIAWSMSAKWEVSIVGVAENMEEL
jgi:hypothetical protein